MIRTVWILWWALTMFVRWQTVQKALLQWLLETTRILRKRKKVRGWCHMESKFKRRVFLKANLVYQLDMVISGVFGSEPLFEDRTDFWDRRTLGQAFVFALILLIHETVDLNLGLFTYGYFMGNTYGSIWDENWRMQRKSLMQLVTSKKFKTALKEPFSL